jgi:hypothetical protein
MDLAKMNASAPSHEPTPEQASTLPGAPVNLDQKQFSQFSGQRTQNVMHSPDSLQMEKAT